MRSSAVTDRVASPDFIGRAGDLGQLAAALDRAAGAEPAVVLLGGEAGVGKSRLIEEAAGKARAAGARVLIGACVELGEVSLPYAPVVQALRELLRELGPDELADALGPGRAELARLLPELGPAGDQHGPAPTADTAQARLFELILRLIERLGTERPLLLVLEDVHWANRSTLDLLTFLARNLRRTGVVLVATFRSDELHRRHPLRPVLAELERSGAERVELARFQRHEVAEQLAAILGERPDPDLVDEVYDRSEGNAFFVEELAGWHRTGAPGALPPTLRDLLLARIEQLPESAQAVLRVAAAAGLHIDHHLLAAVAGRPVGELLDALRLAVGHSVIVPDDRGEAYTFRHALVQEAVYTELLPGERTALHTAYAEALTVHPELAANPSAALAWHWHRANDTTRALPAAFEAGRAAEGACAFAEAQGHYEDVLALWDRVGEPAAAVGQDQVDLLARTADAAERAGAVERALALVTQAVRLVDASAEPLRAALLHERVGRYRWLLGRGGALDATERALALIPAEPSQGRARVLAASAQMRMLHGRIDESRAQAEEAIAVAVAVGARREEGHARNTLAVDLNQGAGRVDEAVEQLRTALRIAEEVGNIDDIGRAWNNLADVLMVSGRFAEGLAVSQQGAEIVAGLGLRTYADVMRLGAGEALVTLGRWDEAEALLTTGTDRIVLAKHRLFMLRTRSLLRIWRGDYDAAALDLEALRAEVAVVGGRLDLERCRAELALWRGRVTEAGTALTGVDGAFENDDIHECCNNAWSLAARIEAERADLARAARDDDAAQEAAAAARTIAEQAAKAAAEQSWDHPLFAAEVAACEAELARALGESDPALWAAAAGHRDGLGQPFPAAYARWRQAEALAAAHAPRDAIAEPLRSAAATAGALGAVPLLDRVEALAARARVELAGDAGPPPSPADGLGLTPREAEVLALVAAGLSNRQIGERLFIAEKTASVHVSNILAKLGVRSRGEAAALAHRSGLA
jgi:ATP/maltotriose-dependent transcriptional regulator MalT